MGIKDFFKVVRKYAPSAIKQTNIIKYTGKRIGIDANLMLYKLILAIRKNGYDLKNDGIMTTHIHTMLLKLLAFKRYDIKPIFVFDGEPPEIKKKVLEERDKHWSHLRKQYEEANSEEEKKKYFQFYKEITEKEINDVMKLLLVFGCVVIKAKGEADPLLASLYKEGIIDYIVTDDPDILVFGGGVILKNFHVDKNKLIEEINLGDILKGLEISMDSLVNLAVLLGTDYCPKIKGIGMVKAYSLIRRHGSMEKIKMDEDIKLPPLCQISREYYKNPPHVTIKNKDKIVAKKINVDRNKLTQFLTKFKYNDDKIKKIFDRLL